MYKGAQVLFPKPYRKINAPHHPGRAHCLFALFAGLLFQHMGDGFKVDQLGDIAAHARIVALFAVGGKGVGRHGKDGHIVAGTVTGADTAGGLRSRTPLSLRDISPHCGESPPQRGPDMLYIAFLSSARYCSASEICAVSTCSLPSRSAMVRATRKMRS